MVQKLFNKIFKRTAFTRTLFFVTADVLLIVFAIWFSFVLRFDGAIPEESLSALETTIILALVFNIFIFYFFGLYSFSWSYASIKEFISLIVAVTFSFLFLASAIYFSREFQYFRGFPRSTLIIGYFLVLGFLAIVRFSKRIYLQTLKSNNGSQKQGEKVLIVGAGDAGEQILRSIQSSRINQYMPVGFVDDNPVKRGSFIHGVKVLGKIDDIPEIIEKTGTKSMVVAFPSARVETIKKAVEIGRTAGVEKIKILPSLYELVNDEVSLADVRDFKIEDLLEREPILFDHNLVKNFIENKVVLVTGAAGSIGSELSRQIVRFNPAKILLLDQDETGIFNIEKEISQKFLNAVSIVADIQDQEKIKNIFEKYRPNIVFHAAAYKHVPLMQKEPEEAVKNNILGTKILAQNSVNYQVEKFIFVSTDKAVNPTSVMGATKKVGELICCYFNKKRITKFISVRFGNVLGSRGSVVPIFKEQIKNGGPVKVTHEDMERYFMIIPEAVSLILEASQMGQGGEVFVLNMGNPVRILDLAKQMIKLSGFEPDKDMPIVFSGSRPGEKMFEEVLSSTEKSSPTNNKHIFKTDISFSQLESFEIYLNNLIDSAKNSKREEIINILKQIAHLNYKNN